jgi:hypothetical protein
MLGQAYVLLLDVLAEILERSGGPTTDAGIAAGGQSSSRTWRMTGEYE